MAKKKEPAKRRALGKGIDALFEQVREIKDEKSKDEIVEIPLSKIVPNENQVRKDFSEKAIEELAESIKNHGLLEPILLTKDGDKYLIVAGERRYRATLLLKREKINAIVRDFKKEDIRKISLIENIQRENLNPVEEALSYKELMDELSLTQEEFAKEIGKSRSHISNSIRLLKLQKDVLEMVRDGRISFGHAKILSSKPMDEQLKLAKEILKFGLSVRETEKASKKGHSLKNPHVKALEEEFSNKFMTKVRIKDNKGRGKIEIEYFSLDDLDRLIEIFQSL